MSEMLDNSTLTDGLAGFSVVQIVRQKTANGDARRPHLLSVKLPFG
jgi:hypothetical protein